MSVKGHSKGEILSGKVGYNFLPGRIGKIIVIRIPLGFRYLHMCLPILDVDQVTKHKRKCTMCVCVWVAEKGKRKCENKV